MTTNILDLPDDVLINLFSNYLNKDDLFRVTSACKRFLDIITVYDVCSRMCSALPLIDYNYPHGFNEFNKCSDSYHKTYNSFNKLKLYQNLVDRKLKVKTFYVYPEKMMPRIQLDDELESMVGSPVMYVTNAGRLELLRLDEVNRYEMRNDQTELLLKSAKSYTNKSTTALRNEIAVMGLFEIFSDQDIRDFRKKDNLVVSFSENKLKIHEIGVDSANSVLLTQINHLEETDSKINCMDFNRADDKLVYGCSNGIVKVFSLNENNDRKEASSLLKKADLDDRVLRCVFSPSYKNMAIGTAGVKVHETTNHSSRPIRIYDFESFKETQALFPSLNDRYKIGAGVLALAYIDENTVMSAGYDTFIRIFDLRSSKCVQSLEEPEDMSIYSVCCSKYYGLISGNDRQSLIRYWDRRQNKVILSFMASSIQSSVYSLACTPDSIFAAWSRGVTSIDFK